MKCTKIIIWCCMVFIISCTEPELPTPPPTSIVESIFNENENTVFDGQIIYFNLLVGGVYTLTLEDKSTKQIISREKFIGKNGENKKYIYTKTIESKYLYLTLENSDKTEIKRTTLIKN